MFASISDVDDDTTNDASVLRDEPSATQSLYYHRNQQYSVIALTDGIGAIKERYAYSAYGEPVFTNASGTVLADSAKDNRYTYTGREWDEELSLYHFRARMFDAEGGRFCGRDPLSILTLATYSYVSSKPLIKLDPTGLYELYFRSEFTLGEMVLVSSAIAAIWERLKAIKNELEALRKALPACVVSKFSIDFSALEDLLDCMIERIEGDRPIVFRHGDLGRDSRGTTWDWPFYASRVYLNNGVNPNWLNSREVRESSIMHELSHDCGTHDEFPTLCNGGMFANAHTIDELMHTTLGQSLQAQIERARLECNDDPDCNFVERRYRLPDDCGVYLGGSGP